MTTLLDINLLPVYRYRKQDLADGSGVYASEPIRRSARSRSIDRLVLYLVMAGDVLFAPGEQDKLLVELSKIYYTTPGSVTSALKAVAEELNRVLLESNRLAAEKGRQGYGLFNQCVVREEQVYLAQSGSVQAYWITEQGMRTFSNIDMSAKGLGLVRSAPVYFSQVSFQPNSTLILSGKNDPGWDNQTYLGLKAQGPESIRRRLVNQAAGDYDVLIAQMRPGKGKIHILQSKPIVTDEPHPATAPQPWLAKEETIRQAAPQELPPGSLQAGSIKSSGTDLENQEFAVIDSEQLDHQSSEASKSGRAFQGLGASILAGMKRVLAFLGSGLGKLFPVDLFHSLSSSAMATIALTVPLIVVTVASVAYFRLGHSTQFEIYYSQAVQAAERAIEQEEVLDKRVNWVSVLTLLQQAEKYQVTGETQALKLQAQNALDSIDMVKRVNYQPAIQGGLPNGVNVSEMVLSAGDLYLLDSQSGKVFRAKPTNQGYELDSSFQCGPSSASTGSSGRLVDMVAWPVGFEPAASVLGVDWDGNLYFCMAGRAPVVLRLALPQEAIGSVKALDIAGNELYIISQGSRAIWVFIQNAYDQAPRDYFSNDMEKPENLESVTDMAVDSDDVYLLHQNGTLTYCYTADNFAVPIRCQSASLVDGRAGRENTPLAGTASMTHLMISSPPDPSLYFLAAANQSVYHVSLRSLIFQKHFSPQTTISNQPATAFTVNPETRRIFLAAGNEIFYGSIP